MNTVRAINPIVELYHYAAGWLRACKVNRSHGEELGVEILQDIVAENMRHAGKIEAVTHAAETHDREAMRLLDDVLEDGKVDPSEITSLKKARNMVQHSARCDHDAGEMARVDAV
jgi:hypothetical protein